MDAWDFVLCHQYESGAGDGVGADICWMDGGYLGVGGAGHENGDGNGAGRYVAAHLGGGESGRQASMVSPVGSLIRRSKP